MKNLFQTIVSRQWLRVSLAAIILVLGMAPIGLPILSDSSRNVAPGENAGSGAATATAFVYQWGGEPGATTRVERSDDGSATWHRVAAIPASVAEIEAVHGQENLVFARSEDAVWVSEDGGETWARAGALPGRTTAMAVLQDTPGTLFVGTESSGLLRSNDRGATWQPVNSPELLLGGAGAMAVSDIRINPSDEEVMYTATGVWLGTSAARLAPLGVFVSVDGGRQWFEMARALPGATPITGLQSVAGSLTAVTAQDADGEHTVQLTLDSGLIEALSSDNAARRAAAARALGLVGSREALPYLSEMLDDPDTLVGDRVVEAIAALDGVESLPALREALKSDHESVRARAAYGLGLFKDTAAIPALSEMLRADGALPARRGAEALATIGAPDAIQALIEPLGPEGTETARHAALIGLAQAGRPAVQPLVTVLASGDPTLRANAAQALGWLKPADATNALIAALDDPVANVRGEAAWALGETGTGAAHAALAAAVEREADAEAHAAANAALARIEQAMGKSAVEESMSSAFLRMLGQVPPTRWTLFGLGVILALALLLAPAVHTRQGQI